jgi:hypothetical protein
MEKTTTGWLFTFFVVPAPGMGDSVSVLYSGGYRMMGASKNPHTFYLI